MTHCPSNSVQVNRNDGEDAATVDAFSVRICDWVCDADEECENQHCSCLNGGANKQRNAASDTVNDEGYVDYSSGELDDAVYAGGEECGGIADDSNVLEDFWGEVVNCVGSCSLVEEEERESKTETASVAGIGDDLSEDGDI